MTRPKTGPEVPSGDHDRAATIDREADQRLADLFGSLEDADGARPTDGEGWTIDDRGRAVGREPELTADHDGRAVADVAEEWLRRQGHPLTLTLTGGRFAALGEAPEQIELDAVELCRIVSGRSTGAGLLTTEVPF